jgi:hypothetical protein
MGRDLDFCVNCVINKIVVLPFVQTEHLIEACQKLMAILSPIISSILALLAVFFTMQRERISLLIKEKEGAQISKKNFF